MTDLFNLEIKKNKEANYNAEDIEVLEGLEPVRKRPGMYVGGIDENALHHLVAEVLDNSMDEAVAGYASCIDVTLSSLREITIRDNGRGIPIDPHPKFPDKSALEVILTTLHSGGKFSNKSYQTAGGLHGVGISVVNALSEYLLVEVVRNGKLYSHEYSRGMPISEMVVSDKKTSWKKGTSIRFKPDTQIFGEKKFNPRRIYELVKAKAYLFKGVIINWKCDSLLAAEYNLSETEEVHFPKGIYDYLRNKLDGKNLIVPEIFSGEVRVDNDGTKIEWAIGWSDIDPFIQTYCNTIPTLLGGAHEQGVKAALLKSFKNFADLSGSPKKSANIIIDDIMENASIILSVFVHNPIFQGQTKEKLLSPHVTKIVENTVKDHLDHWLTYNKQDATVIFEKFIETSEYRLSKKQERVVGRKTAVQKLRLPGKLADCSREIMHGTEIFIVEGDSAGGSAKQARNRETQAILPLRGKILNVANATNDKISQNQELIDLEIALNCGSMKNYNKSALRYEKVIIMTDADVDGSHIASLLMTFFYRRMPKLIEDGHLYIAQPPLYRITQGSNNYYAGSEVEKIKIIEELSKKSKARIELGRFKGLGEMTPAQLKETTMDPAKRTLLKLSVKSEEEIERIVEDLMGKKPQKRFDFINEHALDRLVKMIDI